MEIEVALLGHQQLGLFIEPRVGIDLVFEWLHVDRAILNEGISQDENITVALNKDVVVDLVGMSL